MLVLPVFTAKQVSNPGSPSDHLRALLDLRRAAHGGPGRWPQGWGCQCSPSAGRSSRDGALYAVLIAKKNHVTLLALVWLPGVMADETGVCQGKGVKPREARRVVLPARTGQGSEG